VGYTVDRGAQVDLKWKRVQAPADRYCAAAASLGSAPSTCSPSLNSRFSSTPKYAYSSEVYAWKQGLTLVHFSPQPELEFVTELENPRLKGPVYHYFLTRINGRSPL